MFLILLFFCNILFSVDGQFCPQFAPECLCDYEDSIECNNFDSFNQLVFNNPGSPYRNTISDISIQPKIKIVMDLSFSLNGLILDPNGIVLQTSNLAGFQIDANPFQGFPAAQNSFEIASSQLDLFDKSAQIITDIKCDLNYLNSNQNLKTFFSHFSGRIIIDGSNSFTRSFCLVALYKTNLDTLLFRNIDQTTNQFRFTNEISNKDILAVIKQVEFRSSNLRLTSNLINFNLFKNTERFLFSASTQISAVDTTAFANFKQLKEIVFQLDNFQSFIKSGTQWFANLVNNDYLLVTLKDNSESYEYPESDFCDFASFPSYKRLVFARIESKANLPCTCTLLFLIQNWKSFLDPSRIETDSVKSCLNNPNFNQLIANCDFDSKTKSCGSFSSTTTMAPTKITSEEPTTKKPSSSFEKYLYGFLGGGGVLVFGVCCCCCGGCDCFRSGFEFVGSWFRNKKYRH